MIEYSSLYSWVKDLPIVDWHNHLDMAMFAEDKPLGSLYEVWVKSDPYKHRAMRICGEPERVITGDANEDEKWAAWMRTLGYPKVAEVIAQHHDYEGEELNEAALLYLADKYMQGDREVPLEERFAASRQRCTTEEALQAHNRRLETAKRIENMLNRS